MIHCPFSMGQFTRRLFLYLQINNPLLHDDRHISRKMEDNGSGDIGDSSCPSDDIAVGDVVLDAIGGGRNFLTVLDEEDRGL